MEKLEIGASLKNGLQWVPVYNIVFLLTAL